MIATAIISGILGFVAGALFNALAYDKGRSEGYDQALRDIETETNRQMAEQDCTWR